ncbi:MAG: nucleotidyl transferase AbiEii/AbiGii toxin family protein [Desulfomonilaceae bacterium]|nr:nucleotidyl transferase AbiEii/AbiGii toxin family protein [Desulfomonilaceae bacterium]
MKPLEVRLRESAKRHRILLDVIEKDYAQSYVLAGLMSQPALRDSLVFKGGTALKRVFFGSYRFSEDLDFSAIQAPDREELDRIISQAAEETRRLLGDYGRVSVEAKRLRESRPHPKGQDAFKIWVRFPWYGERICSIKVEITRDEPVLLEPLIRPILHNYEEDLGVWVRCYRLEEIVAEKMRSLLQSRDRLVEGRWSRPRSRDYYDLRRLVTDFGTELDTRELTPLLRSKCDHRGVSFQQLADFFSDELTLEARTNWDRNLGPFVPDLPPFDEVLSSLREILPRFFPAIA